MSNIPSNCRYSESHEWVRVDGDVATVGITDHAQDALGDITFVELPDVGAAVEKGKECGVIESVKAASDLFSPVSGEVTEINSLLDTSPETVNRQPYGQGWLFKVRNADTDEIQSLMDSKAYAAFLESQQ